MDVSNPNPLQSTRGFVDSLVTELAFHTGTDVHGGGQPRTRTASKQTQNALSGLPAWRLARVKPLMLSLHCVFPNDLLPALDILDRGLVQRLVCPDHLDAVIAQGQTSTAGLSPPHNPASSSGQAIVREDIFLVTSASDPRSVASSTFATQLPEKGYEVRLHAWNCTCPTFALSAFRDLPSRLSSFTEARSHAVLRDRDETIVYPFGGTLTCATDRGSPPVCKHVLACVLFARCPGLFEVEGDGKRVVCIEELAGWCAGWGG
ncbi:uncharacterized protein N7477_009263 [Penicillium maclennaniae]|uniref:uncharacterized protein n=1 Tax=Penicillium maclennaniae TaxID=1343394 RepID=UPI0025405053|nr:uncharacterized protein N7477_009263 [Penicillium maclennaniae]KAJ5661647.1 hypothetical protein N7477_009263 [Penicillium maclennaniae]